MENNLSLNQELNALIKSKLSVCNCNPCTCTEEKKEKYFQELKDILSKSNFENLGRNLTFDFLIKESPRFSRINY
jgi:hypothetical protein